MLRLYRKKGTVPMDPWTPATNMAGVSISDDDRSNGSPQHGDMIAHDPRNPLDRWLVNKDYFERNYEEDK